VSVRTAVALMTVLAVVAGCGLKGPLYLPEKSKEVVIRPAPGATPEAPGGTAPGPSSTETAPPPEAPSDAKPPPTPVPDGSEPRPPGSGRG